MPPPEGTEQNLVLQKESECVGMCLEPECYHGNHSTIDRGSSHFVNWGTEVQTEQGSFKVSAIVSVDCHLDRTYTHLGLPVRNCLDGVD